jgi:hypothetical protein
MLSALLEQLIEKRLKINLLSTPYLSPTDVLNAIRAIETSKKAKQVPNITSDPLIYQLLHCILAITPYHLESEMQAFGLPRKQLRILSLGTGGV